MKPHILRRFLTTLLLVVCIASAAYGQATRTAQSNGNRPSSERTANDSTKNIPRGLTTWTIEPRFGTPSPCEPDTVHHLFQNDNFTEGRTGQYNTTGNLGSPRQSRIYNGQQDYMMGSQFIFAKPFDYALGSIYDDMYTNTKSPITNLTWMSQGNKSNGDDRLRALFATNVSKDAGVGFKVDYLYGRGYFSHQQQSSIGAKIFGSYRGDQYNMHAAYILDRTKNAENGGLTDDNYITHPEYYSTKYSAADMPTRLSNAYNRLKVNTLYLTHRYNFGYYEGAAAVKKEREAAAAEASVRSDSLQAAAQAIIAEADAMTDTLRADSLRKNAESIIASAKAEVTNAYDAVVDTLDHPFVPIAAIIHTARFDHNRRYYIDQSRARDFYLDNFFADLDTINDRTRYISLQNTVALEMSEGFRPWVKTGMRVFAKHELARFALPDLNGDLASESFNYINVGANLFHATGRVFRYNVLGEMRTTGTDWGEFNVEGDVDFNIPIRRDSLTIRADGFVRNEMPAYYYKHYHGAAAWWDVDLSKIFRARVNGTLAWRDTQLKVSFETVQNYVYFQQRQGGDAEELTPANMSYGVDVAQASKNVQVLAAALRQDFHFSFFNWENELTVQKTSDDAVLPLPVFTGWTNMYLSFTVAKVLRGEIGADARFFTKYYAQTYVPMIGQYAVQDPTYRQQTGNYPWVNVYANFHLKNCRFYVMYSHVNCKGGNYFYVPHYPTNQRTLRIGISWNFFN